tara:strand:+ start:27900 stop:29108 length:1209 start_codon:yes stop_codon:yes gene_type:complete
MILVSLITSSLLVILFIIRYLLKDFASYSQLYILIFAAIVVFFQAIAVKFDLKPKLIFILILIFSYGVLFFRVPATGGISSPSGIWYLVQPLFAIMVLSPKIGLFFLLASLMQVIIFSTPQIWNIEVVSYFHSDLDYGIGLFIIIFLVSILTFNYEKNRVRAEKKLLRIQSQIAANKKLASMGTLSAGIAHEINNPLMILQGKLYLINTHLQKDKIDRERIDKDIDAINYSIKRINDIIKAVRTFSEDEIIDDMQDIKIKDIIQSAWSLIPDEKKKGIIFSNQINSDELTIHVNPELIERVFANFFDNSCYAIRDQENPWIRVSLISQTPMTLSFMDSGSGIPPEIRERILDPFFTTKPAGEGSGIGLSLTKGIINLHQGQLKYNPKSKHTEFIIELPNSTT